ncbi:MAG: glycosyltransferase family 4 protein [Candidatus Helarchaeota archaeon]
MSKNRLIVISNHFPPEIGGGSSRMLELIQSLSRFHKLYLITRVPYINDYNLYFSFKTIKFGNLNVNKVKLGIFKYLDALNICNYPLILLYFLYLLRISRKDFKILISTPPPEPLFAAWLFSKFFKNKIVLDLRDNWVDVNIEKSSGLIKVQNILIKIFYKKILNSIKLIVSVNDHIIKKVREISNKNTYYILPNIPNIEVFNPDNKIERLDLGLDSSIIVISYAGNLSAEYINIEPFLNSLKYLKNKKIKFFIIGEGLLIRKYKKLIKKHKIKDLVIFLGKQNKDYIAKIYSISDICLVPLSFDKVYEYAIPSKIFEIMACGKAVFGLGPKNGELEKLIVKNKLGYFVSEDNEEKISEILLKLCIDKKILEDFGNNGYKLIKSEYNYSLLVKNLSKLINNL